MSTEHVSPSQHNEPLARREKIHNQGLHILLKMETVTGLSIIPGPANQRIRDRGSLSEIDSLITTAQQAYAERPRHGSLYALETDRTEVFQHNLNGPDSRLRFHDGVYFSNQQPYPLCFIARQHSNTEIYLKQLGQDKDEMRYFQAFACQAGAALFRLQPRWLTLGPPHLNQIDSGWRRCSSTLHPILKNPILRLVIPCASKILGRLRCHFCKTCGTHSQTPLQRRLR